MLKNKKDFGGGRLLMMRPGGRGVQEWFKNDRGGD